MPQIDIPIALLGCLGTCTAYAALLSSRTGRKFTVRHTWITVVAGVLIVLAWYAVTDVTSALRALAFFVAGGVPMIARSWWLEVANRNEYTRLRQNEERQTAAREDYE